ncbi:hypothetical protein X736_30285 [Mesorhizobium sp. L2C089B000]|nr:hypothetical protein X736_30285 [Mesorhizobium sp. L2C089B000]ESZ51679.1 hypothetical protein X731_03530 [Mesorhizobium sp. L2C054A000]
MSRRNLKAKFFDLENAIGHSLKAFGIPLARSDARFRADGSPSCGRRSAVGQTDGRHAVGTRGDAGCTISL